MKPQKMYTLYSDYEGSPLDFSEERVNWLMKSLDRRDLNGSEFWVDHFKDALLRGDIHKLFDLVDSDKPLDRLGEVVPKEIIREKRFDKGHFFQYLLDFMAVEPLILRYEEDPQEEDFLTESAIAENINVNFHNRFHSRIPFYDKVMNANHALWEGIGVRWLPIHDTLLTNYSSFLSPEYGLDYGLDNILNYVQLGPLKRDTLFSIPLFPNFNSRGIYQTGTMDFALSAMGSLFHTMYERQDKMNIYQRNLFDRIHARFEETRSQLSSYKLEDPTTKRIPEGGAQIYSLDAARNPEA